MALPIILMAFTAAAFICLGLRILRDVYRVRHGNPLQNPVLYRAISELLTWRAAPEPTASEINYLVGFILILLGGLSVVTMIAILIRTT